MVPGCWTKPCIESQMCWQTQVILPSPSRNVGWNLLGLTDYHWREEPSKEARPGAWPGQPLTSLLFDNIYCDAFYVASQERNCLETCWLIYVTFYTFNKARFSAQPGNSGRGSCSFKRWIVNLMISLSFYSVLDHGGLMISHKRLNPFLLANKLISMCFVVF